MAAVFTDSNFETEVLKADKLSVIAGDYEDLSSESDY